MNKELFIKALSTLFFSWGSNAPVEAYWAANEFLQYYEAVNNVVLGIKFGEDDTDQDNYDKVIEAINKS
jgi:hypothetical protein